MEIVERQKILKAIESIIDAPNRRATHNTADKAEQILRAMSEAGFIPVLAPSTEKQGYCFITVQVKGAKSFWLETHISPQLLPSFTKAVGPGPKPSPQALLAFEEALLKTISRGEGK